MMDIERALVLAAHTDDGELGCGGTLAKFIGGGVTVYYAAFSICEESVPEGFAKDVLATEVCQATQVLGIPLEHLRVYRYPVRDFPQYRQAILEDLVQLRREFKPDLVFVPASTDVHQDHQVIHHEGLRAFKQCSILGYELPWNDLAFASTALVHLEKEYLNKKATSLKEYRSQAHRNYWNEDLIISLARVRGIQAGVEYAEAFEVLRWVIP